VCELPAGSGKMTTFKREGGLTREILECFLCGPDPSLLVHQDSRTRVIAGLGPIVDYYCVVGSVEHIRSLADVETSSPGIIDDIAAIHAKLATAIGPTIITEHGRVPVCVDGEETHDGHCFHAHALMFPNSNPIDELARRYLGEPSLHQNLHSALQQANTMEHYFLSADGKEYRVYSLPPNIPRQFARTIVSYANFALAEADWRANPARDKAVKIASELRKVLG